QLNAMGIRSKDVRLVVLTHLHHDHTGGLNHFPHNRILASAENLTFAKRWRGLAGAVPRNWPIWFDPEPLEFSGPAVGPCAGSPGRPRAPARAPSARPNPPSTGPAACGSGPAGKPGRMSARGTNLTASTC